MDSDKALQTTKGIPNPEREQFNIVVVGHVDHGKSTVIGRLLADTGSLPDGKLEQVRRECERSAKPFEYAFLLDALKAEQAQGITIDTARCFFKSGQRDYIIIDAPGHIEFLKNMVTGAARAEAAVLVIDAKEGVRENSRRHGYMLSLLGIRQVVVAVNKMDLAGYSQERFDAIESEYRAFLAQVGIVPQAVVPVAAFHGVNLSALSPQELPWYRGKSLLGHIDSFEKEAELVNKPLRMPVQDVYKFTEAGDDRRIIAGRIETGTLRAGDAVVFQPSGKKAVVRTLETFNRAVPGHFEAGESVGITLEPEIYVRSGDLMSRVDQLAPRVARRLRVNVFWMGRQPFVKGRKYKLKLGTQAVAVWLDEVRAVLDASDLSTRQRDQVEQHEVGECVLEAFKPLAWDPGDLIAQTGRFVIVDGYEIAGGGIILDEETGGVGVLERQIEQREKSWQRSSIGGAQRSDRYRQKPAVVILTGADPALGAAWGSSGGTGVGNGRDALAGLGQALEARLFAQGRLVYFLGLGNTLLGIQSDDPGGVTGPDRAELIRRLGETAHLFTDAGAIFIASVPGLDRSELDTLRALSRPALSLAVLLDGGIPGQGALEAGDADFVLGKGSSPESVLDRICEYLGNSDVLLEWSL